MLSRIVGLALAFALAACAAPQTARLLTDASDLPGQREIGGVPFYPQEDNYCGPAALAMVATWAGAPLSQDEAARQVFTPGKVGTLQTDMVAAARRNGLLAVPVNDLRSLLAELAAGHPVVVLQNLSLPIVPQWHYAVAYGYDLGREALVLHSGTTERLETNLNAFERTWKRGDYWGLVVLPPSELPATASERAVLEATVALERTGQPDQAAQAYGAAVRKWPESFAGWMGLGNAQYAQAEYAAAADAFGRATQAKPADPAGWNNLAYALVALKRLPEARRAAEEAVRVSPADAEAYRETLAEIVSLGG